MCIQSDRPREIEHENYIMFCRLKCSQNKNHKNMHKGHNLQSVGGVILHIFLLPTHNLPVKHGGAVTGSHQECLMIPTFSIQHLQS